MGRYIDPNQPFSESDKDFLRSRGRANEIIENERRFGADGTRVPDELEQAGHDPESASFDGDERDDNDYDVGGAPLPGTVLDTDTGRVIPLKDRSDATGAFDYVDPNTGEVLEDPDAFDEDIIEHVEGLPNIDAVKAELKQVDPNGDHSGLTKRRDLDDALIIALQDKRNAERKANPAPVNTDEFVDPANGDSFDSATTGDNSE